MTKEEIIITFAASVTGLLVIIFVLVLLMINMRLRHKKEIEYLGTHINVGNRCIKKVFDDPKMLSDLLDEKKELIPPPAEIRSPLVSIYSILDIARENNFKPIDYQKNIGMISFMKEAIRINIYLTKMTVTTILPHPKRGTNSLYRKSVSIETLREIFQNPRVHTNKGYR